MSRRRPRRVLRTLAVLMLVCDLSAEAGVNRWTTQGPHTGSATIPGVIAMDPRNPAVLFFGSFVNAVYRTGDGGRSWLPSNHGLDNHNVLSLAVDPADSNVVFVGTDFGGVYRSLDGGRSWGSASVGLTSPGSNFAAAVGGLTIDPRNPSTIFASTDYGVYKSLDGGCSWARSSNGLVADSPVSLYTHGITLDPSDSSVVYVATAFHGVYKSLDGGGNWFWANLGGPGQADVVAIDPGNPSLLFTGEAIMNESTEVSTGRVYRSVNGGSSWSPVAGLADVGYYQIVFDPTNSATLYACSTVGIFRSIDGGATWAAIGDGIGSASVFDLAVFPGDSSRLFAITRRGVFSSNDSAAHWSPAENGLLGSEGVVVRDPTQSGTVYAASGYGAGVHKSMDGGATWTATNAGLPPRLSITSLVVDPSRPGTLYAGKAIDKDCWPVLKSTDGGLSWSPTAPVPQCQTGESGSVLRLDPSDTSRLLVEGRYGGFWESRDGGASWQAALPFATNAWDLVFDPSNAAVIYAVVGGIVSKSTDGGTTSTALAGLSGKRVSSLALKPGNSQFLYAATDRDGIFKSSDGGGTWEPSGSGLGDLLIESIVFDSADPKVAYAGTLDGYIDGTLYPGIGVITTEDDGSTWVPFSKGLDLVTPESRTVFGLAIDPTGTRIYAATNTGVFGLTRSVVAGPVVASVHPDSAPSSGGTAVTVQGTGFATGATVSIGGVPAGDVSVATAGEITVTVPPGLPGEALVRVTNPDSQYDDSPRAFVYDFLDVRAGAMEHDAVVHLAARGITFGCGGGKFCAQTLLNRASAAALLERATHGSGFTYAIPDASLTDVASCDPFAKYMYQMKAEGISLGCGAQLFCPDAAVSRSQMAGFLARTLAGGDAMVPVSGTVQGVPYNCVGGSGGASHFRDVPPGDDFCRHINDLAARGIALGCDAVPDFCPADLLQRGDAAIFLDRAFDPSR